MAAAAAAATMATPPAMMQGGAAAAGQLAFSQSSYLGLQLPTNSSPLHFTSFNSKSNRNVQLRCQAAAPSSRTTLPQLNVDITDPKKEVRIVERTTVRLALPSKGRMAEDTLALLKV
jgi:hypothetical protein